MAYEAFTLSCADDWTDFFVETRLRPQLAAAGHMFPQQTARAALPFTHNDVLLHSLPVTAP